MGACKEVFFKHIIYKCHVGCFSNRLHCIINFPFAPQMPKDISIDIKPYPG